MGSLRRAHAPKGPARLALIGLWLLVITLVVVPIGAMAAVVLADGAGASGGLLDAEAVRALLLTLALALVAVVVGALSGLAGALVLVRHRFWGRGLLDALVDLPLAVSPVMTGLAFLVLFGRGGWFEPAARAIGLQIPFAVAGLVIATLFVTAPFFLRELALVMEVLGEDEEDAATLLGASAWQTFRLVTLPNLRHALKAGAALTVTRSLGEFGAVLVLGGAISGRTQSATTFIHAAMEERQEPVAYGMALLLVALSLATVHLLADGARSERLP